MGDYGVYIWSAFGVTIGSMGLYLMYVYYKTLQAVKNT